MPSIFPPVDKANEHGLIAIGGAPYAELLVDAYSHGIFPWPHPEIDELPWFAPPERGVLFFNDIKGINRIKRYISSSKFIFRCDTNFKRVMEECSSPINRSIKSSWINQDMINGYCELHELGIAHSIEVYRDEDLVGGIYGVSLGKMFSAESMFYRYPNASKAALLKLVEIMSNQGATWLDCQQLTNHLQNLGGVEIAREDFMSLLKAALNQQNMTFPCGNID